MRRTTGLCALLLVGVAAASAGQTPQASADTQKVVRKQLRKDKVILVGHSWGSILGIHMVKTRPDLFHAFVGTGQIADPATSYTVAYTELLKKAETLKNERAIRELREVGPPPYTDGRGYGVQRKWSNFFEGADAFIAAMIGFALAWLHATRCQRLVRGSGCQRGAACSANERARCASPRRRFCCAGLRDSGR